jgi:hypothetical protein
VELEQRIHFVAQRRVLADRGRDVGAPIGRWPAESFKEHVLGSLVDR